tara:strand:+ start:5154 stop:5549 length:396 start_codon:yes stop_codon:yes gene_type:complete
MDGGIAVTYIAGKGLAKMGGGDMGAFCVWTLTGFVKNGDTTGVITSTTQISKPHEIKIYPNPTHSQININTGQKTGASILEIYDLRGRLMVTKTFERDLILDVSKWQSGIFFAIIKNEDGAVLHREKVIVE